jgi:prepilin-type N-terminal cleavage/methylation domain-containing protein
MLTRRSRRRGFTLIEVLVALALLLAGIVALVQLFPVSLKANADAVLRGNAALLAQQKVEELRRDHDRQARIIEEIRNSGGITPPVPWSVDPRLAYSFTGVPQRATSDVPGNPSDDFGVARVVVRLAPAYDPKQTILYELRFDR